MPFLFHALKFNFHVSYLLGFIHSLDYFIIYMRFLLLFSFFCNVKLKSNLLFSTICRIRIFIYLKIGTWNFITYKMNNLCFNSRCCLIMYIINRFWTLIILFLMASIRKEIYNIISMHHLWTQRYLITI